MALWEIEKLIKKGDYDYAIVRDHPNATKNGYVLLHRIIMENHIGRLLTSEEVVHHIDGDRHNNNIDNLEIMDRREHSAMHTTEKYSHEPRFMELECAYCHKTFIISNHQYHKESKNHFCSYSCNGKFYANITNNLKKSKNYKKHIKKEMI